MLTPAPAPAATRLAPLLVVLAWWAWPADAAAQVRRCAGPGGQVIYTDKQCGDIGAVERLPQAAHGHGAAPPYRGGCSRRLVDLVQGISTALDARDVNRLATLYDFTGMSTRQGYAVMTRLEGMVGRNLLDIGPIYSRPAAVLAEDGSVVDSNADGYYPRTASSRRAPVGLRVDQVFSNGVTLSRTEFGLRKRLGCWWLTGG